jgi:hypothetical protein
VVADARDADALTAALTAFHPDVLVHQLTSLPDAREELEGSSDAKFRMRTEGTSNLLSAAASAKTIAQGTLVERD